MECTGMNGNARECKGMKRACKVVEGKGARGEGAHPPACVTIYIVPITSHLLPTPTTDILPAAQPSAFRG